MTATVRSTPPASTVCDVLGLGCTAVDEILYVSRYPKPDAKVEVRRRERHCGGLTATALVAASRLGARCAYAGTLGDDDGSRFVSAILRQEGVDLSCMHHQLGASPVQSVIVVDERRRTRNIFYQVPARLGADAVHPPARIIRATRVLLVDRFGMTGMIRAARLARRAGIPVVGDFESFDVPRFAELLALTDHLIVSEDFARRFTGASTVAGAARRLWRPDRAAVVVTCGAAGCCFLEGGVRRPMSLPAFKVRAVDTTGCGDVFHGAYAAALARGLGLEERLRVASAAAALKAMQRGGQAGIPSRRQVEDFLRRYPA